MCVCTCMLCVLSHFSHVRLFATPWTVAHQAPLSLGFSRQEYWHGLPFPPPGNLLDPGIKPMSLTSSCPDRWVFHHSGHLGRSAVHVKWKWSHSVVSGRLFAASWTVAHQAPLSMGSSRQEYWSGCHCLLQGIFPTQGSSPGFLRCRQTLSHSHLSHQGSMLVYCTQFWGDHDTEFTTLPAPIYALQWKKRLP